MAAQRAKSSRKANTAELYNDIMSVLKKGEYSPVYLLMGRESYYIDKVCDYIVAHGLEEDEKDFNLVMYYGGDASAEQVMLQARRMPMMASRQIIVVREAQALKNLDALEKYMDNPVASTVLVICYSGGTIDGRKKIVAKAASVGKVLVSEPLQYEKEIVPFITAYLKEEGRNATIDMKAAQVVAAHIGGDLKRLASELDKVLLSFGPNDKKNITPDIVEQKIGISKEYNVFEFCDALANRDAVKAYRIAKYFDSNPKAGGLYAALPMTFSFFQDLMIAYYSPRPINEYAIMSQLGLRTPFQAQKYLSAMRNYSARKTLDIIAKMRDIDAKSKGLGNVSTPPGELLGELVSFILH